MITSIKLRQLAMPLVHPFTTSFGTQTVKEGILVEMHDNEGHVGYSEIPLTSQPDYCYEDISTAWHVLGDFLIPAVLKNPEVGSTFSYTLLMEAMQPVRGHEFAKAGLEMAYWVLGAEREQVPLSRLLGADKTEVPVGVSIGVQEDLDTLLKRIGHFLDLGYKRIKIKIKPGWDVDVVKVVRAEYADIPLMVDANSAYSLRQIEYLKDLDPYQLMMIEQPLHYNDIIDHIKLQSELHTPICLDESIHSVDDARKALESAACSVINVKVARVGGLMNARLIAELCATKPEWHCWCGGMLESGVGRMINIALQAIEGFDLPSDTSGSDRYFKEDLINPPVVVKDGMVSVPKGKGLGAEVLEDVVDKYTVRSQTFKP